MAASASLTIPVTLGTPAQAYDLRAIFERTPGLLRHELDAAGGHATVQFEFPGNVDALMARLRGKRLSHDAFATIAVPVENLTGRFIDVPQLIKSLNASPAISSATYDGHTVSATIIAATNAVRYMYEEIIIAGLMPLDKPTVAGKQQFVL
ncbi:MAG: hypothetical protein NVS2B8_08340 [Vulcanimicrobiaceae bacterium]